MIKRDDRTDAEIDLHMGKVTSGFNISMPFMVDEYACFICNAYFRKRIFQSDLLIIKDLVTFFEFVASHNNATTLREILKTTNNLTKNIDNLHLDNNFAQVLSDDLKVKLRNTHETKPNKDSRVVSAQNEDTDDFYAKYARDLDTNWVRVTHRFTALKITQSSRILDIGCGFGIFSHVASFNGHIVDSIDIPNSSPILKEATKILKVKKYEFTIKANTPLLKLKNKYDYVTAFQIVFNGHATKNLWDVDEWKFFLLDLHDNILNDNGSVCLVFNGEFDKKNMTPYEVDGEKLFLGKKSLEIFFKPFFANAGRMARLDNKMIVILSKKNIKELCHTKIFHKQSYSLTLEPGKYGT
jgi:SAM-dependent methyltransferase